MFPLFSRPLGLSVSLSLFLSVSLSHLLCHLHFQILHLPHLVLMFSRNVMSRCLQKTTLRPPRIKKRDTKGEKKRGEKKGKKANIELAHRTPHAICMSRLLPYFLSFSLLSPAAEYPLYRLSHLYHLERLFVLVPFNPHDARLPQKHANLRRGGHRGSQEGRMSSVPHP